MYSEIISSLPQSKGYPFPGIFSLSEGILFFNFSGREPLYSISVSIACLKEDIVTPSNWDRFDL